MADNVTLASGDVIRAVQKGGPKTQSLVIDLGSGTGESLLIGGQQLAAASIPVVLTAAQISALTNPSLAAGIAIVGKVGIDQTTPGTTNLVQLGGSLPAGSATIGATQDAGPAWTTVKGINGVPFTSSDQHSAAASVTDAPTSGQKLVITDIFLSVDTAMSVTFKCETSGVVITGPYYLPANGTLQLTPRGKGWKLATADKKLQVITSVAGNVMADISYYSEV